LGIVNYLKKNVVEIISVKRWLF